VAETPARYCSNCGHELGDEGQFCPNCGSPVHRAAHVPTPEADVPVPQPPRAGGTGAAAPEQPAQRGFGRRHPILTGCLGIIVLLIVLSIIGAALGGGGGETAGGGGSGDSAKKDEPLTADGQKEAKEPEKKEEQPKPEPETQPEQEDSKPNFSDGTYQVGTDIQPGTYRTREGSSGCYYERLSGFSGEFDDILANGNTVAPAIIAIKPTDAGFLSQDCGTWTKDLSAITESKTTFGEGAYIVGTDIEPGTYRNSGSSSCYYERLSEFTGDLNAIIANGNAEEPTVVTIGPADAGFQSNDCGTWTKLEF